MAKPKRRKKGGGGGGRPAVDPAAIIADLESEAAAIAADPAGAGPRWGAVHKLLLKTALPNADAARLIATRDVAGLQAAIARLQAGDDPTAGADADAGASDDAAATGDDTAAADAPDIDPETLRAALKAFRKRLKLVRLDHESRLGVGPMSSGRQADVDAILAPQEFPSDVWEALVRDGRLKSAGGGFYMLPSS